MTPEEINKQADLKNQIMMQADLAEKWLAEREQGLTGDEVGIMHTYLDRSICAEMLVAACKLIERHNDELEEAGVMYNNLWAHSSEVTSRSHKQQDIIRSQEKKIAELEANKSTDQYLIFKSKDEQGKFFNQGFIKGYEEGSRYALEVMKQALQHNEDKE